MAHFFHQYLPSIFRLTADRVQRKNPSNTLSAGILVLWDWGIIVELQIVQELTQMVIKVINSHLYRYKNEVL